MMVDWIRRYCMGLPHTTETVQWGEHLVFKVGGKIYAIAALEPDGNRLSFKCSLPDFAELCERESVIPAPYLARAQWVALETEDALAVQELKRLLKDAHGLVFAKLSRKKKAELVAARGLEPRTYGL
jgi:predicted DNA-binding protein (MmcQ/YjbR family)